ncbi:ABC transporter permease [Paenibacillus sp. TRM 82003]|uniref:ABC transporter permease n=1 Tax=Kineococcus sp. TRM81007 TaxID=2925831 RepID=UPI001F576C4A|nr:ABC transporter permease [Kineococcus sp. TRM81007]MCI2240495.1 ABC transporter permease [Kineococcus sp. TRM81007]MCI3925228.1 ABC transporter permease [Paenibacillus sp. TRM 82003]
MSATPGVQRQWWLVADREMRERLRDKGFVFSTLLLLVIVLAAAFLPGLVSGGTDRYEVAATSTTAPLLAERPGESGDVRVEVRTVADAAAAEAAVRAGDVDAAVLPSASGAAEVVGDRNVPSGLGEVLTARVRGAQAVGLLTAAGVDASTAEQVLTLPPPAQRLLDPDAVDPFTTYLLGLAFAVLFLQIVVIFGYSIAQSVVMEKQTRVVELLVTTVPVNQLLVGKIVGNGLLALGQIVLLVAAGLGGLAIAEPELLESLPSVPTAAVWFVVFFVVGFAMLSCLWAAAGAMASRLEDLQSTATPVQMLVMLPFFATFAANDPGTLQTVLSYVPLSSPMVMPKRVLQGDVGWTEPLIALLVIAATAALFVAVARRLYENSLLQTGRSLSLRSAWRRAA